MVKTFHLLPNELKIKVFQLIERLVQTGNRNLISERIVYKLRSGEHSINSHLLIEKGQKVIGYAHIDNNDLAEGSTIEFIVDPMFLDKDVGKKLLTKAIEICDTRVWLWVHGGWPASNTLSKSLGFDNIRTVLQMSKPITDIVQIPQLDQGFIIRNFIPGIDSDAWLSLNNKVFKEHPEQGNWQLSDLNIRLGEEWFDEQGFFLAEINNKIIGSTWTKIHGSHTHQHEGEIESHAHPAIGEIYITAVDQEYSGRGIGKVLTITALNYLKYQGFSNAMLYVDFDNKAALNLYQSLGFTQSGMDILYKLKA
jgi:mycothiol synthase